MQFSGLLIRGVCNWDCTLSKNLGELKGEFQIFRKCAIHIAHPHMYMSLAKYCSLVPIIIMQEDVVAEYTYHRRVI